MAKMRRVKSDYTIDDDFFGGEKFKTSIVLMQVIMRFAEMTPAMSKHGYINYVWYTLYPLTAYLENKEFKKEIKKILDNKSKRYEEMEKQRRQILNRPLLPNEKRELSLDVDYQAARDAWLMINALVNVKLGEEYDIIDSGLDADDVVEARPDLKDPTLVE